MNNVFTVIGASNHSEKERQKDDFYATDPIAVEMLLDLEKFNSKVLEPACGLGHISKVLAKHGYNVTSSDIYDRGFGNIVKNFADYDSWDGDIITNPPYKYAQEFVEHALKIIPDGNKIAMLLKLTFLEGKSRRYLFRKSPPIRVWVSSSRIKCSKNGRFDLYDSSAIAYAWFIWVKAYKGDTIIKWFN